MVHLIDKSALVAKIERLKADALQKKSQCKRSGLERIMHQIGAYNKILSFLDTIESVDPYEQLVQYASIESGIKSHAEDYSFNIESELFNQLTKEQQALWRKEIEQACISGGYNGFDLAKDPRYKENFEIKKVDLEKEISFQWSKFCLNGKDRDSFVKVAKHFFELGLKAQKGE